MAGAVATIVVRVTWPALHVDCTPKAFSTTVPGCNGLSKLAIASVRPRCGAGATFLRQRQRPAAELQPTSNVLSQSLVIAAVARPATCEPRCSKPTTPKFWVSGFFHPSYDGRLCLCLSYRPAQRLCFISYPSRWAATLCVFDHPHLLAARQIASTSTTTTTTTNIA